MLPPLGKDAPVLFTSLDFFLSPITGLVIFVKEFCNSFVSVFRQLFFFLLNAG